MTITENPYRRVHRIESSRRRYSWMNWALALAAVVAAPLAEPAILHFAQEGKPSQGLSGLVFRMQAFIAALMALYTYSNLIRGPDRPVLDPHPVRPIWLMKAIAYRGLKGTFAWPLSVWFLAWPLCLHGQTQTFLVLSAPVFASWLGMTGLGYAIGLAAVWASRNASAAPLLDMVRGNNPREQASFIYAPGFALFIIGMTFIASANAIEDALAGDLLSIFVLVSPILVGALGWILSLTLAPLQYVPASAVLAEIDARWASLETQEEENQVYLEWLARGDRYRVRAFRQGWRSLRSWPLGAWLVGSIGLIAAWSDDFQNAELISSLGALIVIAIPFRMAKNDPEWLDLALGLKPTKVALARAWTAFWYAQGAILPSCAMIAFQGGGLSSLISLILMSVFASILSAFLALRLRGLGLVFYAPTALVIWAAIGRL